MSDPAKSLPSVFEFDDYRKFLRAAYESMKAADKKFSFRYFARVAGFNAHSFLRIVMQGKSNLSPESADKITKAFKFNQEETHFFKNLVLMNQAETLEERRASARELLRSQTYRKIHPLEESKYQFFAKWYVSAVRELIQLPAFREDPKWIAAHVIPQITVAEARGALEDLKTLGLVKHDENGKLVQADAKLATGPEVASAYVSNWHREYLKIASESIETVAREKRDISAVTFCFTQENIKVLKELVANFRKEVVMLATQQQGKDVLLQMNIQIFPLGEADQGGDK